MKQRCDRFLAWMLTFLMFFGSLPVDALADTYSPQINIGQVLPLAAGDDPAAPAAGQNISVAVAGEAFINQNDLAPGGWSFDASSSNSGVASATVGWSNTHNASGILITGVSQGSADITVSYTDTAGAHSVVYHVTVGDGASEGGEGDTPATGISMPGASVAIGSTVQMAFAAVPEGAALPEGYATQWSSDAQSIATVDTNGLVSGLAEGTANISVTIFDAEGKGLYGATAAVSVTSTTVDGSITVTMGKEASIMTGDNNQFSNITVGDSSVVSYSIGWNNALGYSALAVKGLKTGSTTISFTYKDYASSTSTSYVYSITVTEPVYTPQALSVIVNQTATFDLSTLGSGAVILSAEGGADYVSHTYNEETRVITFTGLQLTTQPAALRMKVRTGWNPGALYPV